MPSSPGSATREQIWLAFAALVGGVGSFALVERRVHLDQSGLATAPNVQPAAQIIEGHETTHQGGKTPVKRLLQARIWVWARLPRDATNPSAPDGSVAAGPTLNPLLDALDTLFGKQDFDGYQTLGGLVERAWQEGETIKVDGTMTMDGQCFAEVPISILVP